MSFRPIFRKGLAIPTATALFAIGAVLPKATLHAESPSPPDSSEKPPSRKPIYDSPPLLTKHSNPSPSPPESSPTSNSPTPTDRLASQIGVARLFLHGYASSAETSLNNTMSHILHLESSFTSTIASLAPPPSTNEQLLPGSIYVLVSAMASSIVTRNRNILLRASVPVAVGIGAGWVVLPHTMRNVGDLLWKYEERVPVVAENHMRVRGAMEEGARQGKIHWRVAKEWAEKRIGEGRETLEDWVSGKN